MLGGGVLARAAIYKVGRKVMSQSEALNHTTWGESDEREDVLGMASSIGEAVDGVVDELLNLLRSQVRLDFRAYRRSMVMQRIERRMRLLNLPHIDAYLQRCQASPPEVQALGREICSGPALFFREPDAFEYLGNSVIPALLRKGASTGRIRIWVAGCATGEEAYSIGMLLREQCDGLETVPEVKIFATDIDPQGLEVASRGLYSASRLTLVS
jgi:two-component system CheB/CheR fusion protein